jgi:hypothetical protein
MVDNQNLYLALGLLQFEAELLLDGLPQSRPGSYATKTIRVS